MKLCKMYYFAAKKISKKTKEFVSDLVANVTFTWYKHDGKIKGTHPYFTAETGTVINTNQIETKLIVFLMWN